MRASLRRVGVSHLRAGEPGRACGPAGARWVAPAISYDRVVSPRNPNAPGTPGQDRKSFRTRRRILDCAAQVLRRRGYDGTRISEIAEIAELRLPAVYYYFSTREELIEDVVVSGVRATHDHVEAALAALEPSIGALERICVAATAHLEMVLVGDDQAAAAMRTVSQLPPELRAASQVEEARYGRLWRGLFDEAVNRGELDRELDPRGARMLVLGALNWATEWWDPAKGTIEEIAATTRRLVHNALQGSAT